MLNLTTKRSQLSLDKCLKLENYDAAIQQLLTVKTFRSFTKDQKILLSKLLYSKYFALKLKYDDSEPQYNNFDDFLNNFTVCLIILICFNTFLKKISVLAKFGYGLF